ncbi:MAG: peptide deformylase [Candidatus Omnitrophica bacterium]|nr:peptide deformylase [Candidatus Omnitrophota bacterium]
MNLPIPQLTIRLYGDPCLRERCDDVKEIGIVEKLLVEAMIETMDRHKGIGLAAPQVGVKKRILVVDIGDGPVAMINPVIKEVKGEAVMEEGCLSIPEVNVDVVRPAVIKVRYRDLNNKPRERKFKDLMARVVLHESDHLDGKLIVDYATDEELQKYDAILKKLEAQHKL